MSDRIEKESEESEVVKRLECIGATISRDTIVNVDWRKHISQELQQGLYLVHQQYLLMGI